MSHASKLAVVAAFAMLCGLARAESPGSPETRPAGDGNAQAVAGPQPQAAPAEDAELVGAEKKLRDRLAQSARARARLVPMQQYSPNAGQTNPALQWGSPAQTAPPAGSYPPGSYSAAQPTASPDQAANQYPYAGQAGNQYQYAGQSGTQYAGQSGTQDGPSQPVPAQPAPAYGDPMWPKQGPQRVIPSPDGGYVPGPLFSEDSPFLDAPPDIDPTRINPLKITAEDTMTGKLMFGVGVNSDAGVMGQVLLEEQNFDWTRWPSSWEDVRNGTAFRGAGERFRIEAMPGTQVQRYAISFDEPYLYGTQVQMGLSGFYYTRIYNEYSEQQLGGGVTFGYALTPDLSVSTSIRMAKINIYNPIDPTLPDLAEVTGRNLGRYGFGAAVQEDKRDNPFLATEGYLIRASFEQVLGSFTYPRGELDVRKYFTLYQRPDLSGRHVLTLSARASITGDNTPIYDRFYAGGFSSLRGFQFRGASPSVYSAYAGQNIFVGGDFQLLASIEYLFPITADDMLHGVVFCDTGTVEPTVSNWSDRYRVAPGFGLRITVPAMGPAPIALDFAFPVSWQPGDRSEMFSFFVGFGR